MKNEEQGNYAVNEDGITVFDRTTGTAVCVCGPNPLPSPAAFHQDQNVRETYATVIARALNETAARQG
jgi:hypothetical protein